MGNFNVQAIDDGYGDVKYIQNGKGVLIPSFVTSFKSKPEDLFSNGIDSSSYLACEVDGIKYTVGDYASKLDPTIKWIGGENKHTDNRFPIILKTTLGLMATNPVEDIDLLVMNLPIRYDTPERRELLKSIAIGNHTISISNNGRDFIEKSINVRDILIKKQPFGSLCDMILDDFGDITDYEVAKSFIIVVDIGARTMNILTLDGLEEQPHLTVQTNDGMFEAYNQVSSYLEHKFNTIIPEGKLPQIIRSKSMRGLDITPLIDHAYRTHANNAISVLDRILVDSWGFVSGIVFTGGGAELLKNHLKEGLSGRKVSLTFLDRFATVRGLNKFGQRHANKLKGGNIHVE